MTDVRNLKIKLDASGTGTVELEGHDISSSVSALTIHVSAGDQPTVRVELDLQIMDIEVSSLAEAFETHTVNMTDEARRTLQALGWTPPAEETNTYKVPRPTWDLDCTSLSERPECDCQVQRWRQHEIGCPNRNAQFPFITPTRTDQCTCPEHHDPFLMNGHHPDCFYNRHSPDAND